MSGFKAGPDAILKYWLSEFFPRKALSAILTGKSSVAPHMLPPEALPTLDATQYLACSEAVRQSPLVWIAPCVYEHPNGKAQIPYWVLAEWENQTLQVKSYPWFRVNTLSPQHRLALEQAWQSVPQSCPTTWDETLSLGNEMMNTIFGETLQGLPQKPMWVLPASDVPKAWQDAWRLCDKGAQLSALIARFLHPKQTDSQPEKTDIGLSIEPTLCYAGDKTPLDKGTESVLSHCLSLPEQSLQSVQTSIGTDPRGLICHYALSKIAQSAIDGDGPYKVLWLQSKTVYTTNSEVMTSFERWLPNPVSLMAPLDKVRHWLLTANPSVLERHFIDEALKYYPSANTLERVLETLKSKILQQYEVLLQSSEQAEQVRITRLRQDRQYESHGGLDAYWATLQARDVMLEADYSSLAQACVKWAEMEQGNVVKLMARRLPVLNSNWREQIWNFYDGNLQGLIPWEEDAYGAGRRLTETLNAKLRGIRTQRSKLHQMMVPLSESLAERSGAVNRWMKWQNEKIGHRNVPDDINPEAPEDISHLVVEFDQKIRHQVAQLAIHIGECRGIQILLQGTRKIATELEAAFCISPVIQATPEQLERWLPLPRNLDAKNSASRESINTIFFDVTANNHPISWLPVLYRAKRAVIMGDDLHAGFKTFIAEGEDTVLATNANLVADDFDFDELRAKGLVMSHANALALARSNSWFKPQESFGVSSQSDLMLTMSHSADGICQFLNDTVRRGRLVPSHPEMKASFPPFSAVLVKGHIESTPEGDFNMREAQTVVAWVKAHLAEIRALSNNERGPLGACVVTTTAAQADRLNEWLPSLVPAYCFDEIPPVKSQIVLFSPVVNSSSRRPFVFDSQVTVIPKLASLAVQSVIIVGDIDLLDANTNGASGLLARALFSQIHPRLNSPQLPLPGTEAQTLRYEEIGQLRSSIDQLVQKARDEIIIISPTVEQRTLETWRLTGDLNKAIGRKVSISVVISEKSYQALESKKILSTWIRAGVKVLTQPHAMTQAIMVDEDEVYELNFDMLSINTNAFPVGGLHYQGNDAARMKRLIWPPIKAKGKTVKPTTSVIA